jgi:hypothetical protein
VTEDTVPATLRARICADLSPVRPLLPPGLRTLVIVPLGALLLVGIPAVFQVREDAPLLGPMLLWGLSALEAALGVVVVAAALSEAVPGRQLAPSRLLLLLGSCAVLVTLATASSWNASRSTMPPGGSWWSFFFVWCYGGSLAIGLAALGPVWRLARGAFPLRRELTGALAGGGAGLMTDSGWRVFCHVAEPGHVLATHVAALMSVAVVGALLGRASRPATAPRRRQA